MSPESDYQEPVSSERLKVTNAELLEKVGHARRALAIAAVAVRSANNELSQLARLIGEPAGPTLPSVSLEFIDYLDGVEKITNEGENTSQT